MVDVGPWRGCFPRVGGDAGASRVQDTAGPEWDQQLETSVLKGLVKTPDVGPSMRVSRRSEHKAAKKCEFIANGRGQDGAREKVWC